MTLLLSEADVRRVLSMTDLIDAMEPALARFSAGEVQQPLRTVLDVSDQHAFFGIMPAYVPSAGAMGAKLVTVFGGNPARGLPSHLAIIVLLSPETGAVEAIMDGRYITEARTAAVSAVAAKRLARANASTLAILGSGVQASSHLEAFAKVRPLKDVRVWSPTPSHRDRFVREASRHLGASIRSTTEAAEAVEGADLIVCATSSPTPVLEDGWVSPGAFIAAVGACRPTQREIDPALTARARLYVDSRISALAESGDVVMAIAEGRFGPDHIVGEVGDVVAGRVEGRLRDDDIVVFKSLGLAVEDIVAAQLVKERARAAGVGVDAPL